MIKHRTPPKPVREQLSQEVKSRCPICGEPYLTYHHFDPPYHVHPHNNPEGMIALCHTHHDLADQGKFTLQQLRELKKNPNPALKSFGWLRNDLIFLAGGFYINPSVLLRLKGRNIIWINRSEVNELLLNVDIRDNKNNPIILIEDNDLIYFDSVYTEIKSHGHILTVKSPQSRAFFSIHYKNYGEEELKQLGQKHNMELDTVPGPDKDTLKYFKDMLSQPTFFPEYPDRDKILEILMALQEKDNLPTRWTYIVEAIQGFPVTICTIQLKLKNPIPIDIDTEVSLLGRLKIQSNIVIGGTVLDLQ